MSARRSPLAFVRSASPAVAVVLSCTLVLGCNLLKKKAAADGGDDAVDAATVTVTGSGAKNEKDVLRYASEVKLADEPGTIGKDGTKPKTFPSTGVDVATLASGTPVTKIATFFSTGVLVVFADPAATDGSKLMGWIAPEALAAAPVAATATATATTGTPTGAGLGALTKVVAAAADAGAAKDAGVAAADAGVTADAGKAAAASTDAGAAAAPVITAITAMPGAGHVCPGGMILVGSLCRRPCITDAQCPKGSGATCKVTSGKKTCAR